MRCSNLDSWGQIPKSVTRFGAENYNEMVDAFGQNEKLEDALKLFDRMFARDIIPPSQNQSTEKTSRSSKSTHSFIRATARALAGMASSPNG